MIIKVHSKQHFPENDSVRIQEGKEAKILANSSQHHEYVAISGANLSSSGSANGMKTKQGEITVSTV